MSDHWIVTNRRYVRHASLDKARTERERLTRKFPEKVFRVVRVKKRPQPGHLFPKLVAMVRELLQHATHDEHGEGADQTRAEFDDMYARATALLARTEGAHVDPAALDAPPPDALMPIDTAPPSAWVLLYREGDDDYPPQVALSSGCLDDGRWLSWGYRGDRCDPIDGPTHWFEPPPWLCALLPERRRLEPDLDYELEEERSEPTEEAGADAQTHDAVANAGGAT
jgi:hypothetical protein